MMTLRQWLSRGGGTEMTQIVTIMTMIVKRSTMSMITIQKKKMQSVERKMNPTIEGDEDMNPRNQ